MLKLLLSVLASYTTFEHFDQNPGWIRFHIREKWPSFSFMLKWSCPTLEVG